MTNEEKIEQRCAAFIAQLRALREQRGLSTTELAEKTGLKQSNISRLENGKYPPNLITIMKLASALNAEVVVKAKS